MLDGSLLDGAADEVTCPGPDEPAEADAEPAGAAQHADVTGAEDGEPGPVPPVRRRIGGYGDRVDGWVRPHHENGRDLSFSGE